ncbi:hypothetical protein Agub_g12428, partial [Astrephomene gubernaculifera]
MAETMSFSDLDGQLRLVVLADYRPKASWSDRHHEEETTTYGPSTLKSRADDIRAINRPAGSPLHANATPSYQPGSSGRSFSTHASSAGAAIPSNHNILRSLGFELMGTEVPQPHPSTGRSTRSPQTQWEGAAASPAAAATLRYRDASPTPGATAAPGTRTRVLGLDLGFEPAFSSRPSAHHHPRHYGHLTTAGAPAESSSAGLTSSLVARMELLRAQLMRVSSTLAGVQERATMLSSSLDRSRAAVRNSSGFPAPPFVPTTSTIPAATHTLTSGATRAVAGAAAATAA